MFCFIGLIYIGLFGVCLNDLLICNNIHCEVTNQLNEEIREGREVRKAFEFKCQRGRVAEIHVKWIGDVGYVTKLVRTPGCVDTLQHNEFDANEFDGQDGWLFNLVLDVGKSLMKEEELEKLEKERKMGLLMDVVQDVAIFDIFELVSLVIFWHSDTARATFRS